MALVLDLTYSQSNDAITLTITDSAGTYHAVDNDDGWGAPNYAVTDIVASATSTGGKYHLELVVVVTDKYNTETTYDTIDLYDHALVLDDTFTGFADAGDLTWTFTPDHFDVSGTAMGTSADMLDDGIYDITYSLKEADTGTVLVTLNEKTAVDGDVRIDVYNKLRNIPYTYENEYQETSREIMEALLAYSYLQAIEGSAAVCLTEDLVNMLYTLDKLVSDGSHYTW